MTQAGLKNYMASTFTAAPSSRYSNLPRKNHMFSQHAAKSTRNQYMTQGGFTFENNIPVMSFGESANSMPARQFNLRDIKVKTISKAIKNRLEQSQCAVFLDEHP
jgi:hypothetical protein